MAQVPRAESPGDLQAGWMALGSLPVFIVWDLARPSRRFEVDDSDGGRGKLSAQDLQPLLNKAIFRGSGP